MIGLFNKTSEIKGEIGYLGLQDWWLGSFSQQERDYIEKVYQPFGLEPGSKPLTQSEISWSSQTPAGLLCNLAGWFNNPKDREISKKIIEEANVMALLGEAVLDRHFTLQQTMEIYYCERETTPGAMEKVVTACREQIRLTPQTAKEFIIKYPDQPLPGHAGYLRLRIILEKQGEYDEALGLCEQAKKQGWTGNWDKQIETLKRKKLKSSN